MMFVKTRGEFVNYSLSSANNKLNFSQTLWRYLCLYSLVVMLITNAYVVHAQPVEQDFDGISFVKVSSGEFIFGTAPDSNY